MNNFKWRAVASGALLSVSAGVLASDYQMEFGASWFDFDGDSAWGADATLHFAPVRNDRGPHGEAPFLNRSSNLQLFYVRETGGDFDIFGSVLEVYSQDFYFAAGYSRFSNFFDLDAYGLRLGWMAAANTRLSVGWERLDASPGGELDIITAGFKHVALLADGQAFAFDAEAGVARNGGNDFAWSVEADYYFNRNFSFGPRWSGIDSDDQFGLGARYFFTPRVSGEVEWLRDDGDDIWEFRLAGRF